MKRILALMSLFALAAILLTACNGVGPAPTTLTGGASLLQDPTETPIPTAPAAANPTYVVQRGTVQEVLAFSGRWMPRDQMELSFEVAGTIRRVNVARGDTVQAGDLLADFDTRDLESQLASAQLDLETAIASMESGEEGSVGSIESAMFSLASANLTMKDRLESAPWVSLENARRGIEDARIRLEDAKRAYDDAISDPGASASAVNSAYQQVRDAERGIRDAELNYFNAAQSYNSYVNSLKQQENNVLRAEMDLVDAMEGAGVDANALKSVKSAQMRIDEIKAEIALSSLFAPIDGVVLEVSIAPGDSVQAFNTVITIAIPEPKEVIAALAFNDTQQMNVGMVGVCQVMNQPESAVGCAVRQIPLSSRDADQSVRVAADFGAGLPLGQLVEAEMPLQVREDVLWLPPAAIRTFQNRIFVVVQEQDGQRVVDVTLGLQTGERVEIVSGLEEGDLVVGQ